MLTAKQEKFVQELIKGKSQREAYKEAYNAENMSDNSIDREASILFNTPKISQRYEELVGKSEEKALWTREQAVKNLVMIKDEAVNHLKREVKTENGDAVSFIDNKMAKVATDAIKELNNMYGYNEQKIDVKSENELTVNINVV